MWMSSVIFEWAEGKPAVRTAFTVEQKDLKRFLPSAFFSHPLAAVLRHFPPFSSLQSWFEKAQKVWGSSRAKRWVKRGLPNKTGMQKWYLSYWQASGWKRCELEVEEGQLNLSISRDLVTDALCYEAFNKLWIGSSHFPLLTVTAGQLIDSWHCVHGCTCMYVENMMTTTNWNVWDIKMHHLVMNYLICVTCGPMS